MTLTPCRVLVVDDNEAQLQTTTAALRMHGFEAMSAGGAISALELVRRALEMKASARLDALRSQITMMLPHELHTPLTVVFAIADLLETTPQCADFGRLLKRSGDRLHRLTQRFLTYAQIEVLLADTEAVKALRARPVIDCRDLVEHCCRAQAEANGRASDLRIDLPILEWPLNDSHLTMVVGELVENALKFSQSGQLIHVSSDDPRRLTIRDCGVGIQPHELREIGAFVQFNRKVAEQQGAGLGLVICKRVIEAYGGAMRIRSEPGAGTSITIEFAAAKS